MQAAGMPPSVWRKSPPSMQSTAMSLAPTTTPALASSNDPMEELRKESAMGAVGTTVAREVRVIDLRHFEQRRAEITEQLWRAATETGFFQVSHHGIDQADVDAAFARSEQLFALPESTKAQWPLARNAGWESRAQIRPSTGKADLKESYQVTRPRMAGRWPSEVELPGFQAATLQFEAQCWAVGMRILSCFAERLELAHDFFAQAHQPGSPHYQSTLRMLRYFAQRPDQEAGAWRAGAHTDFDCLTLLFQRPGQGGLEVLPGKEAAEGAWTPVPPVEGVITCNIGDMLMRWSDDQLLSNFHRVRNPGPGDYQGDRYSLAFFCQANEDITIRSPSGKYPDITAADYLQQRINANFANTY